MPWIPLTVADLKLTGTEVQAVMAQKQAGSSDPFVEQIEATVNEVRGRVAANRGNAVGESGTIPATLKDAACAIIRYRVLSLLPVKILTTPQRETEYKAALELLRDVAKGTFAVEQPETVTSEVTAPAATVEVVSAPARRYTREKLDGL